MTKQELTNELKKYIGKEIVYKKNHIEILLSIELNDSFDMIKMHFTNESSCFWINHFESVKSIKYDSETKRLIFITHLDLLNP